MAQVELLRWRRSGLLERYVYDDSLYTPIINNMDNTIYATGNNTTIYQTASCAYNSYLFSCWLFTTAAQLDRQYSQDNGNTWIHSHYVLINRPGTNCYFGEENQIRVEACIYTSITAYTLESGSVVSNIPYFTDNTEYNNFVTNLAHPPYEWSSVPAISGKNGILSLPVLIDTDGNPVSNGSASDFSTLPDGVKVRTLADLAVQ